MNISKIMFRSWFYFRQGWGTYFAFIMAGINTLTITYFLAIEKYPLLLGIFPTFLSYVVIIVLAAVPILAATGYLHFKKSNAYKAEADIGMEVDPYNRRLLLNTEMMMPLFLQMSSLLTKLAKNQKISDEEYDKLDNIQKDLSQYIDLKFDKRYLGLFETDIDKLKKNEKRMK
jgi:hypothetical protein|tara:strand:+ start:574 stop:1092 length:519 start_codon:yes stop_codon:yes gene_type:complete